MNIPIIIICYNNHQYVKNTLSQILTINKDYYKDIIILNNASTCENTIKYLKNLTDVEVIDHIQNFGPWISLDNNKHIYDLLPNKFILTDPDLKFNKNIPSNFIEILANLSEKYKTSKIAEFEEILEILNITKKIKMDNCININKILGKVESINRPVLSSKQQKSK